MSEQGTYTKIIKLEVRDEERINLFNFTVSYTIYIICIKTYFYTDCSHFSGAVYRLFTKQWMPTG
jgi:hypothetical protein